MNGHLVLLFFKILLCQVNQEMKRVNLYRNFCALYIFSEKIFNCINKSMALNYNIVPRVGLVTISYYYLPLAVYNFSNEREINLFQHLMKIKTFLAAVKINSYTTCIFFFKTAHFFTLEVKKNSFQMFFRQKKF